MPPPIYAASTSGVLRHTSIRLYKMPLVLALLLHPILIAFEVELRNPVDVVKLGSLV